MTATTAMVLSRHHDGTFATAAERTAEGAVLLRVRETTGETAVTVLTVAELHALLALAEG